LIPSRIELNNITLDGYEALRVGLLTEADSGAQVTLESHSQERLEERRTQSR